MARAGERTEWRFACLIVSSLLFGAMAVAVVLGATDNIDAATRADINRWASPNLTVLAEGASFIGSVAFLLTLTVLTATGLWVGGRPRAALMLSLAFSLALILNNLVKLAFARARPEAFFGIAPDTYSFASGHVCSRPAITGSSPASSPRTSQRIGSAPLFGWSPARSLPASGYRASIWECTISPTS